MIRFARWVDRYAYQVNFAVFLLCLIVIIATAPPSCERTEKGLLMWATAAAVALQIAVGCLVYVANRRRKP